MSDVDLDSLVITMDLPRLGELIAAVAMEFTKLRDLEPVDVEGQEMKDLALASWQYVLHMADRASFAREVQADLAKLSTQGDDA